MAQRSNFQIDDIKINKRGNAFFMDIDAMVGHIKLSDAVIRQFGNIDIKVIKKPHPEISIEEAERLLKCKIVRE